MSKEELEKEKIKVEIKNLKRWWIQPLLSLLGLFIILATALFTNLSEYLKIKKMEDKEQRLNTASNDLSIRFLKTFCPSPVLFGLNRTNFALKVNRIEQSVCGLERHGFGWTAARAGNIKIKRNKFFWSFVR